MRFLFPAIVCLASFSLLLSQESDSAKDKEKEEGFVSLFDGKTLAGWKGRTELWKVDGETLVGSSKPAGINFNTFLISEKEYGDFILKLEFKFSEGNSGVQFRSRRIGDAEQHRVSGYQADIGEGYHGALYDEARRNRLLKTPEKLTVQKAFKKGEWNEYEIRAKGEEITLILNGTTTSVYQEGEREIARKGIIALQLHGGPPMEIRFRNIRIKPLDRSLDK